MKTNSLWHLVCLRSNFIGFLAPFQCKYFVSSNKRARVFQHSIWNMEQLLATWCSLLGSWSSLESYYRIQWPPQSSTQKWKRWMGQSNHFLWNWAFVWLNQQWTKLRYRFNTSPLSTPNLKKKHGRLGFGWDFCDFILLWLTIRNINLKQYIYFVLCKPY